MSTVGQVTALVPMRHHSERVPGKNYRQLAGRALYEYILDSLHAVSEVASIVVDTDSPLLQESIASQYPDVILIDRPEEIRGGDVPMNTVLMHDAQQVEAPYYLQTHSTNPFLRPQTIRGAIQIFFEAFPESDSLFGVTPLRTRLWGSDGKPINHDPQSLQRTQDLEPVFEENSCLYIFEREGFLQRGNRLGKNPRMFEIEPAEAWDIDDEWDFAVAEALMVRST